MPVPDPDSFSLALLWSKDDDGIATITSKMGWNLEFQMAPVAPNHIRAACMLMNVTARRVMHPGPRNKLVPAGLAADGATEIVLTHADTVPGEGYMSPNPEITPQGAARVAIRIRGFGGIDFSPDEAFGGGIIGKAKALRRKWREPGPFLTLCPPDGVADRDQWLMESTRALGMDTQPAMPLSSFDSEMERALARARAELPQIRQRFLGGFSGDTRLGIKLGLKLGNGECEYVWCDVKDWSRPDSLRVELIVKPVFTRERKMGEVFEIPASDVSDFVIGGETDGMAHPGHTQRLAGDFGMTVG